MKNDYKQKNIDANGIIEQSKHVFFYIDVETIV
jgi:hypothetical protein